MKINAAARLLRLGDTALTVEFGTEIDPTVNARVLAAVQAFAGARLGGVHDIVAGFGSVTLHFDPLAVSQEWLAREIGGFEINPAPVREAGRERTVPVLYGGDVGPDLEDLARAADLSTAEVAALHAGADYHVYMLGFLPGFAYLGDLPEKLRHPRLAQPRTRVPAGSVAVADRLTAVYPAQSPGGWRLIGRTPIALFDAAAEEPSFFAPGDRVSFQAIGQPEFDRLSRAAAKGDHPREDG